MSWLWVRAPAEAAARFSTFAATELKAKRIEAIATQVGVALRMRGQRSPHGRSALHEVCCAGDVRRQAGVLGCIFCARWRAGDVCQCCVSAGTVRSSLHGAAAMRMWTKPLCAPRCCKPLRLPFPGSFEHSVEVKTCCRFCALGCHASKLTKIGKLQQPDMDRANFIVATIG